MEGQSGEGWALDSIKDHWERRRDWAVWRRLVKNIDPGPRIKVGKVADEEVLRL